MHVRSRFEAEFIRQWRLAGRNSVPDQAEIQLVSRAVRLALRSPTAEMLKAGWGHHINLESQLGRDYAADDYDRVVDAFFQADAADCEAACGTETHPPR